jgi:hypothetical protein
MRNKAQIECHNPDGSSFHVPPAEAENLLRDNLAERIDKQHLRMKRDPQPTGRLSLRVGAYLTAAIGAASRWHM